MTRSLLRLSKKEALCLYDALHIHLHERPFIYRPTRKILKRLRDRALRIARTPKEKPGGGKENRELLARLKCAADSLLAGRWGQREFRHRAFAALDLKNKNWRKKPGGGK